MTPDVAIVDYGAGNLTSVAQALAACGATPRVVRSPEALAGAALVVLPGVGHFEAIARALDASWRRALCAHVAADRPLLGICLGMQFLFDGSDEAPEATGLGLMAGRSVRLRGDVKVPHVGWNSLDGRRAGSRLLEGLPATASAYFTHGYALPDVAPAVAQTTHGLTFTSAVEWGCVFGTQFHPEKSGAVGLRMLGNVLAAARETV